MRPITKWAYTIPSADKVQEAVRSAFRVALTEPQGPMHIDVSKEILLEEDRVRADRAGGLPADHAARVRRGRARPRRRADRSRASGRCSSWAAA